MRWDPGWEIASAVMARHQRWWNTSLSAASTMADRVVATRSPARRQPKEGKMVMS
jgi:hypothetical protein